MSNSQPLVVTSAHIDVFGRRMTIRVVGADALGAPVDVLALKFAQKGYGVDREALRRLNKSEWSPDLPEEGETLAVRTHGAITAPMLLLVGTVPIAFFEYAEIREFARRAITALRPLNPGVVHLGMTIHGVRNGLDETEAFTAQLAGCLDALRRDEWPATLETITIYELDEKRAQRLGEVLERSLPKKLEEQLARSTHRSTNASAVDARGDIESAGLGSRSKPHVFVAMQFGPDTDDRFHYGIQAAVRASGFLCERIDSGSFTGDILTQIKARIDSASFVVADLSAANPNVYLEVGYAWGRNIKTVLLAREAAELRFDVQSQRCVLYSSIRDLEQKLTRELRQLSGAQSR